MLCFWIPLHVKPENAEQWKLSARSKYSTCTSLWVHFSWKELSFSYLSCWMLQQIEVELSKWLYSSTEAVPSYSLQLGNWHLISLVPNIITSSAKWNCDILWKEPLTCISRRENLSELWYSLTSDLNLTQRHYETGGNKNNLVLTLYAIKIHIIYRT